jgi:ribonuclease E
MAKYMLIEATHSEETRVAIVKDGRLEEFDFETTTKQTIKSNIYLAKVVRVEPSLQAAFVEFGGNRHGFLPFSEIHPDYYRIPVSDRAEIEEVLDEEISEEDFDEERVIAPDVEVVGGDEAEEFRPRPRMRQLKQYKIQEVVKKRQIMLVQVVKEERGNKGAAMTTYLSLAGRYCVLMPNAGRGGGGISRKINDSEDRKRLRSIVETLEVPEGMGLIIRTAGIDRSKVEVKRDFDYLLNLWDEIREQTLKSIAPTLIHAEGALITRAIRDMYSRDIDRIIVEGEQGFERARSFVKKLVPSHVKRVELYKDKNVSLFQRYNVETQIDGIHNPMVQLPSGGYIVLNPTEALVSVDVNSGRATRERHIEETALKTNLEAAEEIARELRLRDLAGLVVIDFIDMEESRNIAAVERRLKESMAVDKARIQIGRISSFGLLELSRQRLRPSIIESITTPCPHCAGTGLVRSVESSGLRALRAVEALLLQQSIERVLVYVAPSVALFVLNHKRNYLSRLEVMNKTLIHIVPDKNIIQGQFKLEPITSTLQDTDGVADPSEKISHQPATQAAASDARSGRRRRRGSGRPQAIEEEKMFAAEADAEPEDEEVADPLILDDDAEIVDSEDTADEGDNLNRESREQGREGNRRRRRRRHRGRHRTRGAEGGENPDAVESSDRSSEIVDEARQAADPAMVRASRPEVNDDSHNKDRKGWWQRLLK